MYWSSRSAEVALGLAAGVASTAISHPLDLLKVRLQLQRQRTSRAFDLIKTLISAINADAVSVAARGNHRLPIAYYHLEQWYRGVAPNLVGNAAAWSLYFVFYAEFKDLLASRGDRSPSTAPTTSYFGASALAGITTSVITNPLWVLKTRILATPRGVTGSYVSMADAIRFILRDEGIATFWRGTIPSLFLVLQASIQFSIYDQLNDSLVTASATEASSSDLSSWQYIYASAVSKTASMCLLYPAQVLRTRLQAKSDVWEPKTIIGVCKSLWTNEGYLRGFYRGMGANMLRVLPSTCITFITYESVKSSVLH